MIYVSTSPNQFICMMRIYYMYMIKLQINTCLQWRKESKNS